MSTRSPQNKRTQERLRGETKGGMMRKSAGSAKPARAAAESVRVVPANSKAKRQQAERGEDLSGLSREEKRARKAEIRRHDDRVFAAANVLMREDFDYNRYRKIWMILIAAGIAVIVVAFILFSFAGNKPSATLSVVEYATVAIADIAIFAAFIFDFVKIRPIRNEARAKAEGMSEARLSATVERGASKEDSKRADKEAKKAGKRGKRK